MNSSLYICDVMHYRLEPARNRFLYQIFMLSLDLDEIDRLDSSLRLFRHNRFGLFSFWEKDHLEGSGRSLKENITSYARERGVDLDGGRVQLLTHLRVLGYIFNPVCFYFCWDRAGRLTGAVVEVENTYREKKRYWLGPETLSNGVFRLRVPKYFYVSPFAELDAEFDFRLAPPSESLAIYINDWKNDRCFLLTSLTGRREDLTDRTLLSAMIGCPFVTLKVIVLIHWQALILKLKGLPHIRKADQPELQREVKHAPHHS